MDEPGQSKSYPNFEQLGRITDYFFVQPVQSIIQKTMEAEEYKELTQSNMGKTSTGSLGKLDQEWAVPVIIPTFSC